MRLLRWGLRLAAARVAAGARGGSALLLIVIADKHVCYAAVAALGVTGVLVIVVRKFRDDVPCVEDSWDLAEG